MVRTRHSGDVRADSPPRFLSFEGRRSKKSISHTSDVDDINDSDQSGIIYGRSGHSIFEEKVVESRLRPRVGPRRAYNYVYEDSSDDDSEAIFSRRRQVRLVSDIPHTSGQRRRYAECERSHSSEEDTEESVLRSTRNLRRTRNQLDESLEEEDAEHGSGDDDENDMNNSAVRRSSRLRQKPYRFRNSMTESQEDKGQSCDREDRGKKRHLNDTASNEYEDMYSRVKRPRNKKSSGQGQENSVSNTDASNDEAEGKNDSEDETQQRRAYSLREHKPRTQLYMAPAIEAIKKKPKQQSIFRETPPRRLSKHVPYRSPAHRNIVFRKRQAFHGSSSSTSSDSSESETETDEQHFNRRKAKSMAKARSRIMPLNFTNETVNSTVLKDRIRAGASLADVDPMEIDRSVTFENIGGLQNHIMALKEMIVFPLLYPEFYEKFKVAPSRGVLFYGPPGTGKTLVARALANECSQGKQRVAFFMRKGADCLSKWVGEAERQLRLLFDKAYEMRPSIIFFDEIDGLAPVRSSRQDQIHSSIVSTLLALMDGLDCRGEIVVIGATNRIDSIDPALRRPGRFDREFHFPLPNFEDRKKILKIHTKSWDPLLRGDFITELAEKCAGYCGADIKCLVTQATQNALRRHYPQIYTTSDKLQLDVGSITLTARDFAHALTTIVPAAQRAVPNPSMALEPSVRPLLQRPLKSLCEALVNRFPHARLCKAEVVSSGQESFIGTSAEDRLKIVDLPSDDEDAPSIFMTHSRGQTQAGSTLDIPAGSSFMGFSSSASNFPTLFRPRLLVSGELGQGQTVHLAPAALHFMEHLSVHTLSSAALFAASAKMPEEACANIFHEAKRTAPSVIYMPYINELWSVVTDSLRVTFLTLVRSMTPTTPVLLLATSEVPYSRLEEQLKQLFSKAGGEVVELESPTSAERHLFFEDLILHQTIKPPTTHKQAAKRILQPLPKAPPPESHQLTEKEEKMLFEQEEDTLRELRIFLRDILSKLGREKKFSIFTKPVDIEDVPDYYDIIKKPMDLSTMMGKIDLHHYTTTSAFMDDIFLICSNALEYNPDKGPTDRAIRHRACALRDTAQALLKAELDPAFEKLCQEISQSRKNRGVDSTNMAPAFYRTRPISAPLSNISTCHGSPAKVPIVPDGCRFSRRVRGLSADKTLPVDIVEKSAQIERSLLTKGSDTLETETGNANSSEVECIIPQKVETLAEMQQPVSCTEKSMCNCNNSASSVKSNYLGKNLKINCDTRSHLSSSALKKLNLRKKCPWLATRRRKRHYLHVPGKEIQSHRSETEIKNTLTESCGHEADLCQDSVQLCEEISPELLLAHSTLQLPSTTKTLTQSASYQNRTSSSEVCINSSEMDLTQVQNSNSEQIKQKLASSDACPCSDSAGGSEQRPDAARCLEVELNVVATDSGIGSSLESNGDSRDSLEHNNSNKTSVIATESQDSGQEDEGIKFARTRARMQNPLHISAFRALEIETQPIIVDKEKLKQLLEDTVQSTEGFSVEKLQHLYSVLSCTVYRHRQQYDKNQLVQEMEKIVENFCVDGSAL